MRSLFAGALLCLTLPVATSAQNISAEPTYGSFELGGGFLPDPQTVDVTAGGSIEVDVGECDFGHVADAPDANFDYDGTESLPLYIFVESEEDTMLLVNGPDGSWYCDDDGLRGLNPLVTLAPAPDGLYNVWVGTYEDEMVSATLKISELDPRE